MKNLQMFKNDNLGIIVRTIKNADGSISINAEDTAIGFGWTTIAKSGNKVIRWNRINQYCVELGFTNKLGKDDYIPESLFYMLGMKASNEKAKKFQQWLAVEVIPSIRENGTYGVKSLSSMEQLELQLRVLKEQEQKINKVNKKIEDLESSMPLFTIECKTIQSLVRKIGTKMLGGHGSVAYKNNSVRGKVYADIQRELRRNFDVDKYEAIKRCQIDRAIQLLNNYKLPIVLEDEITLLNYQEKLKVV